MKRVLLAVGVMLASTAAAQVQKWEYANFVYMRYTLSTCAQPVAIDHFAVVWLEAKKQYRFFEVDRLKTNSVRSFADFNEKVYGKRDSTPVTADRIEYQNILGSLGWEMVSYSDTCEAVEFEGRFGKVRSVLTTNIWYKRPVK